MQGQVRRSALSRLQFAVLTTLLTILGLVGISLLGAPAQAHDQLISSDPKDGATLDKQPEWIELTFSGDIQEIGSEVQVKNADGKDVSAGEITVEGRKLSSALPDDLAAGKYTIVYRVVSQDGHPISDELTFTIADANGAGGAVASGAAESGAAQDGSGDEASASAGGDGAELGGKEVNPDDAQQTSNEDAGNGMSPAMIIALAIGGLAAIGIVFALLVRKNKGFSNE